MDNPLTEDITITPDRQISPDVDDSLIEESAVHTFKKVLIVDSYEDDFNKPHSQEKFDSNPKDTDKSCHTAQSRNNETFRDNSEHSSDTPKERRDPEKTKRDIEKDKLSKTTEDILMKTGLVPPGMELQMIPRVDSPKRLELENDGCAKEMIDTHPSNMSQENIEEREQSIDQVLREVSDSISKRCSSKSSGYKYRKSPTNVIPHRYTKSRSYSKHIKSITKQSPQRYSKSPIESHEKLLDHGGHIRSKSPIRFHKQVIREHGRRSRSPRRPRPQYRSKSPIFIMNVSKHSRTVRKQPSERFIKTIVGHSGVNSEYADPHCDPSMEILFPPANAPMPIENNYPTVPPAPNVEQLPVTNMMPMQENGMLPDMNYFLADEGSNPLCPPFPPIIPPENQMYFPPMTLSNVAPKMVPPPEVGIPMGLLPHIEKPQAVWGSVGTDQEWKNLSRIQIHRKAEVISRCESAIPKLDFLHLPNRLICVPEDKLPPTQNKSQKPSPLHRMPPPSFKFTSKPFSILNVLLPSIVSTLNLENEVVLPDKDNLNLKNHNPQEKATQTDDFECKSCVYRKYTQTRSQGSMTTVVFKRSVHSQVADGDLANSRTTFTVHENAHKQEEPVSLMRMTPAQILAQLSSKAKSLQRSTVQAYIESKQGFDTNVATCSNSQSWMEDDNMPHSASQSFQQHQRLQQGTDFSSQHFQNEDREFQPNRSKKKRQNRDQSKSPNFNQHTSDSHLQQKYSGFLKMMNSYK